MNRGKMNKYVALHNHSEYSSLDGYSRVEEMAKRASEIGMTSIALTDHGEVSGHLAFYDACKKLGVNPILGMEGYLVDSIEETRETKSKINSHYCIWAETQEGLANLWAISTKAYLDGFYYKPLADWDILKEHSKGVIVSDGCMLSNTARYILEGDLDKAREWIGKFVDTFGEDNFFLELHTFQFVDPQNDEDKQLNDDVAKVNAGKISLAKELNLKTIVVNDAHFSNECDHENHDLVWAMSTSTLDQMGGSGKTAAWIMDDEEVYYWMSKHGVSRSDVERAIEGTVEIGERCSGIEVDDDHLHLPSLTGSEHEDLILFHNRIKDGWDEKIVPILEGVEKSEAKSVQKEYNDRLEYEAKIITDRHFHGYFNVVADYVGYAKMSDPEGLYGPFKNKEPWLVGPARGSGGGSLVAWLMGITELDPVKYDLIFERFINPDRKGFPDFDIDFPQSKKPFMKDYLEWKYGKERVCGIGTFSRLQPRGLLRDLGKAMRVPYNDINKMSTVIEEVKDIDTANIEVGWDEILIEAGGELAEWADKYPELFQKMEELMGLIRQTSTHAAGTIVSDVDLMGVLPLRLKKGEVVSQFEMYSVERLGFIKFDILGLRHLDTLMEVQRIVDGEINPKAFYELTEDDYSEEWLWDEVGDGRCLGQFQLETPSMSRVAKTFKPKNERDVADLISVNRPGVVRTGMLGEYLKRRTGEKPVTTPHPLMTEILGRTFGVVVFQEQVMRVVQRLAGYSLSEADGVRKIMGKMLYEQMKEEKPVFIKGCLDNPEFMEGVPHVDREPYERMGIYEQPDAEEVAELCWQQIEAAGIYSFNSSHAQAYALISTWEVIWKKKHEKEFLTALMRTNQVNSTKYVREARRLGIKILPPCVNESEGLFTLTDKGIRYGLSSVASVGSGAVKEIVEKRPYTDYDDYLEKTSGRGGRRKNVLENLISIGAFDSLGQREQILDQFYKSRKMDKWAPDFSNPRIVTEIEMELVGTYITFDPMEKYIEMIEDIALKHPDELQEVPVGKLATIGGQITKVREHEARNGLMAFCSITWNEEVFDFTIFANTYSVYKPFISQGAPVMVEVQRSKDYNGSVSLHLKELVRLDHLHG